MADIILPRTFKADDKRPTEVNKFIPRYPAHAYHADREAISQGSLQEILRTPSHFLAEWAKPYRDTFATDSTIIRLGKITGEMLFEPEMYAKYFIEESFGDQRKKENKQAKQDWLASLPREYVLLIEGEKEAKLELRKDAPVITEYEQSTANAMAAAIRAHPELAPIWDELLFEQTVYHVDPETGLLCRSRLDIVHVASKTIWDLKTTENAAEEEFARVAGGKAYHFQGSSYKAAAWHVVAGEWKYKLAVVERDSPFEAVIYDLGEQSLAVGDLDRRRALTTLRKCIDTGVWPGYPAGRTLNLPPWILNKTQQVEGGF